MSILGRVGSVFSTWFGGGAVEEISAEKLAEIQASAKVAPGGEPTVVGEQSKGNRTSVGSWLFHDPYVRALMEQTYGPHNPSNIDLATYDLMRHDWTIGFAIEIWRTVFANSEFWFEGGSDELNAFATLVWDKYSPKWIPAFLHALPWGCSSSEKMWARADLAYQFRRGNGADSVLVSKQRRGAFVIERLRDYDPRTVTLFRLPNGDYGGFRVEDASATFAPEDTVHTVFRSEFGNLRSRPISHNAYSPWWWCNFIYLGVNRYLEKKGDPPLVGYAPSEKIVDQDGNEQDPIQVTATLASNVRRSSNVILPNDTDLETRMREYELREMQVAARAEEFETFATHYESLKALGCLTAPDLIGIGSGGAFAKSKTSRRQQHGMFTDAQNGLIVGPVNEQVMPQLIRANFGDVSDSDMPRLRGGSLSENARDVLAELVKDAQRVMSITRDGRPVPVGSRIDWARAMRQLSIPLVDEDSIPDGLGEAERPTAGRPSAVATNPDREEGPGERGLSRAPIEVQQFARIVDTAEAWLEDADQTLQAIDARVNRAAQAVESARLRAERELRKMLAQVIREAKKEDAADGRRILSADNRRLPRSAGREAEEILLRADRALLAESDIDAQQFARRTPLAAAHIDVANSAREFLERSGLPAPSGSGAARVVSDVVRDGKTNSLSVPTREGRRIQEQLDRMFQDGTGLEEAKRWLQDYKLPSRDLQLSTVSHVRGSARAMLGHRGIANSPDVGGWVVSASPSARAKILEQFPDGRVAKVMFQTFESGAALDQWFANMRTSTGAAHTSWKNLGLTYFSDEYYLPVSASLWPAVAAAIEERRSEWSKERFEANQRRAAETE